MFKLDYLLLNYILNIFPWPNNAGYGSGAYAKLIIILLFGQQVFNIVYSRKKAKGGNKNVG